MNNSYLEFVPPELFAIILDLSLDPDAENLLNIITSYPHLRNNIVYNFLYLTQSKIYLSFKEIQKLLGYEIIISDDFLDIIYFVVTKYDTSDNINFIEKYKNMLDEYVYVYVSLKDSMKNLEENNGRLNDIIIHLIFYNNYPSILKYYYKNFSKFTNYDIKSLLISITTLLQEEYNIINTDSLDEDTIIDLLKLWEKDNKNGDNIKDMAISGDLFIELRGEEDYKKLVKFLMENDVDIV